MTILREAFMAVSETASGHLKIEVMWGDHEDECDPKTPAHAFMLALLQHSAVIAKPEGEPHQPRDEAAHENRVLTQAAIVGPDGNPL